MKIIKKKHYPKFVEFVKNARYTIKDELLFDTNLGTISLSPSEALTIACALFDCFGESYEPLEQLEDKVIRRYVWKSQEEN